MGAADEVSSLVQLAGGIIFGGFALYKLTSQKDEVDDGYETDDSLLREPVRTYKPSPTQRVTPKKPVYEVQKPVKEILVEEPQKPVYTPSAVEEDHYTPSWASTKQPQLSVSAKLPSSKIPSSSSSCTSESKSFDDEDEVQTFEEPAPAPETPKIEVKKTYTQVHHTQEREEFVPSWMSKKEPQVKFEQVQASVSPKSKQSTTTLSTKIQCGNASISRIAYNLSDTVFIYALGKDAHFGKLCVEHSNEAASNHFGQRPDVKVMESRAGAGSCVVGSLQGGSKTTVLAHSDVLKLMTPSMFEISANRLPTVFHIAATAIDQDSLSMTACYADIMRVRDSGFAILSSSSAQEIADFAVVSHALAHKTSTPVMHVFDGTRGLTEFQKISVPAFNKAAESIESAVNGPMSTHGLESAAAEDRPYIACAVQEVMDKLSEELGSSYRIFEYTGPEHPQAVVVAMGTAASVLESVVKTSNTVGVINVRLLRPWSASHFLSVLPKSCRRICVLDQSGSKMNPLFLDVASALHSESASEFRSLPLLVGGRVIVGSTGFDLAMAHSVISNVTASRPQPNFTVKSDQSTDANLNVANTKEVIVWSKGNGYAAKAAKEIAAEIANEQSLNVQHYSAHDPFSQTHKSEIRLASVEEGSIGYAVTSADVVVASTVDHDVACSVRSDGKLIVIKTAESLEQDNIPESVNSYLSRNNISVLTLREHEFSQECDSAWVAVGAAFSFVSSQSLSRVTKAFRSAGKSVLSHFVENVPSILVEDRKYSAKPSFRASESFLNDAGNSSWMSTKVSTPVFSGEHSAESFSPKFDFETKEAEEETKQDKVGRHQICWNMIFKEAYEAQQALKPSHHDVHIAKVTKNMRLTPVDYSRNIFHMEFDISSTPIKYEIGDALGVFGHNDEEKVDEFIAEYGLDPDEFVALPARGGMEENKVEYVSVRNMLIQHLDLFGRPSKKFYVALAQYAKPVSRYQYLRLMHIGTDDAELFKLGIHETVNFADLLLQFTKARPTASELAHMIPEIKPRHYSISSSMKVCPRSVHLLVVAVDWETPLGKKRTGQCTRYLNALRPGQSVTVDIQKSVLRLPPNPKQPIVMAGLGTGMAPFRAFIQERFWQMESGIEVGPCVLYFGARHKAQEWLYGEELEKYEEKGLVRLGLAWSRDQKHKVYIQHKIEEDGQLLKKYLGEQGGYFYLCGPTWPVPDVRDAIAKGLTPHLVKDGVVDVEVVEELKDEGRYILEVY